MQQQTISIGLPHQDLRSPLVDTREDLSRQSGGMVSLYRSVIVAAAQQYQCANRSKEVQCN